MHAQGRMTVEQDTEQEVLQYKVDGAVHYVKRIDKMALCCRAYRYTAGKPRRS